MTALVLRAITVVIPRRLQTVIRGVAYFFSLFARAVKARKTWERLSAMNDEQLAKRGLVREDITNVVRKKLVSGPH